MTKNPKVSIIIPVYNGSNYLKEAIDSALNQTYENVEVTVVNDGSNDNGKTEALAKSYGDRIKYYYKENGGVASALNYGIKTMSGDYFSWLSHDDVYFPEKIQTQIDTIKFYSYPVILYSDFEFIDENSNFLRIKKSKSFTKNKFRISLITSHKIHGCTLLIPKECFEKYGYFNEKLMTVQDYELWFRFAKQYKFIHIPRVLIKSRLHKSQGSYKLNSIKVKETNLYYKWAIEKLLKEDNRNSKIYLKFIILLVFIKFRLKGYDEASSFAFKKFLKF